MNKKAVIEVIELSMGTVVVVVIAIVLLSLALVFVRPIIDKVSQEEPKINEFCESNLELCICEETCKEYFYSDEYVGEKFFIEKCTSSKYGIYNKCYKYRELTPEEKIQTLNCIGIEKELTNLKKQGALTYNTYYRYDLALLSRFLNCSLGE